MQRCLASITSVAVGVAEKSGYGDNINGDKYDSRCARKSVQDMGPATVSSCYGFSLALRFPPGPHHEKRRLLRLASQPCSLCWNADGQ